MSATTSIIARGLQRAWISIALSFIGFVSCAYADGVHTPAFERVQLSNGAVLILTERHDVPLITFQAVLRGGALADPADKLGLASLTVSLLEKGAAKRNALEFAQTVASVGGSIETGAATESDSISGSFLARDRALMVELLADMLQRPHLDAEEFSRLRDRDIEFIRAAKDSDLSSVLPIYADAALFGSHPYGRPVGGDESTLAKLTIADVQQFYAQQLGADRLILSVAGDFKTAEMKRLLTRAFGSWRKAQAPLPSITAPAHQTGRRVVLIDAPESVQSYFWAGNIGVARKDPRRAALDIVNTLFGGRFTSMLNVELRTRTGLSYGASSGFDRMSQPGHWGMTSFTRTETTIDAIDLALSLLDKLHAAGIEAPMVNSARAYVLGQYPLALETASQWSSQLAVLEFYGLDRHYIDDYPQALADVDVARARKVVDGVFPASSDLVLVVIGKASAIREGLKKYGPITEMKLSDPVFATAAR
jgi:predicted Zn-dependent peptidase